MAVIPVDVWTVGLRPSNELAASFEQEISSAELERANRFHFAKDRQAYIAAHGTLRRVLAKYLQCAPQGVRLAEGVNGKPAVEGLRFNLTHSGDLALIAVTPERELGVDVEKIDPRRADRNVAERFFAPDEVRALEAVPVEQQTEAFFHCWTRKEAYLKAIGLGLSVPLDSFSVSLTPGEPARLLRGADPKWQLCALAPDAGYIGALAVDAGSHEIAVTIQSIKV